MPSATVHPSDPELRDYLAGRGRAEQIAAVASHLARCKACREYLAKMKAGRISDDASSITDPGSQDHTVPFPSATLPMPPRSGPSAAPARTEAAIVEPGKATRLEPQEIGGFRLIRLLGQGGMGQVFLAEDPRLKRPVAIKLLRPEVASREDAARRFQREAQAMAAVKHENVVTIYQVGEDQGAPFMAQELLEGQTLQERLRGGTTLSVDEALRIGRELALGLAAAHAKGLLHRDIKPGNIWLEAGTDRVRILDFGLAFRDREAMAADMAFAAGGEASSAGDTVTLHPGEAHADRVAEGSLHTTAGMILGTPGFMAPEQAKGIKIDARADLFSLGCVLYQIVTGRRPFQAPTPGEVLRLVLESNPPPVMELNRRVPPALSRLIEALMAKDPAARPESATEVAGRLATLTVSLEFWRRFRRRGPLVITALLLLVTSFNAALTWWRKTHPPLVHLPAAITGKTSFKALEASAIPVKERFAWQPRELVAVLGQHRRRCWQPVWNLELTNDGRLVSAPGRLIDLRSQLERELTGDTLIIAPDGLRYFTDLHYPRLAEVPRLGDSSFEGAKLLDERCTVGGASFSFDGRRLAVTYLEAEQGDVQTQVWDVSGPVPQSLHVFPGEGSPALSPEGTLVAVVRQTDGRVHVHDTTRPGAPLKAELPGEAGLVDSWAANHPAPMCQFLTDGRLATLDRTRTLRIWDLTPSTPQLSRSVPGMLAQLSISDTGGRCVTFDNNGFQVVDLQGETPARSDVVSIRGPGWPPVSFLTACVVTRDGWRAVTGHLNGALRIWDIRTGNPREIDPLAPQPVFSVRYVRMLFPSPDGRWLATRSEDVSQRATHVYRLGTPQPALTPLGLPDGAIPLGYLAKGDLVTLQEKPQRKLTVWHKGELRMHAVAEHGLTDDLRPLGIAGDHVLFECDSELQLQAVAESPIKVVAQWPREAAVQQMASSADGTSVAALMEGGLLKVWRIDGDQVSSRTVPFTAKATATPMTLSPDGQLLAVAHDRGYVLWEVGEETPRQRLASDDVLQPRALAFSPDGKWLAATCERMLVVNSVSSSTPLYACDLPGSGWDAAFSPDNGHVLVANGNGTVYVLRIEGDDQLAERPDDL